MICLVIKPVFSISLSKQLQCSQKAIYVTRKFAMPATSRQYSHSHFIRYFLLFNFFPFPLLSIPNVAKWQSLAFAVGCPSLRLRLKIFKYTALTRAQKPHAQENLCESRDLTFPGDSLAPKPRALRPVSSFSSETMHNDYTQKKYFRNIYVCLFNYLK